MRKMRSLQKVVGALGLVAALCACASAPERVGVVPTAQSPMGVARSAQKCGVVAHYIVFVQPQPADAIEVIQVQEVASYLQAFPKAYRLAGATIVYPDKSKQVTQDDGAFDAGRSAYAEKHPVGKLPHDVTIEVFPPKGKSLAPIVTKIFAPSEGQERGVCSDALASNAVAQRSSSMLRQRSRIGPAGRITSCDPNQYQKKALLRVQPGHAENVSITAYHNTPTSYRWNADTCGTDIASDAIAWAARNDFRWFNRTDLTYSFEVKSGFDNEKIALWVQGKGKNGSSTFLDVQLAQIEPLPI